MKSTKKNNRNNLFIRAEDIPLLQFFCAATGKVETVELIYGDGEKITAPIQTEKQKLVKK